MIFEFSSRRGKVTVFEYQVQVHNDSNYYSTDGRNPNYYCMRSFGRMA